MSLMNRKMFNRNARNKLNAMGGIRTLANGGLTMGTNPRTKFNPNLVNQLVTPSLSFGQISDQYMKGIRGQGPLANKFLTPIGQLDVDAADTRLGKYGRQLANIGLSGLENLRTATGIASAFTDPSGNIIGDFLKQPTESARKRRAQEALDVGIMTTSPEIQKNIEQINILEDQERMQQGQLSPTILEQQKKNAEASEIAEEENLIAGEDPDKKKIIKPDPIKPTITEEQQKILDDQKRRQEGQLGTISIKNEEEVKRIVKEGTPEEQQAELKQLMQEFTQNAPKYEGMDKNLALAKMFFSIAAGDSPDAVTNIAKGLEQGADAFIKDKAQKDEFNRQVQLSALKYGLGEIGKNKAFERQKALTTFNKQFDFEKYIVGPEGFTDERGNTYAEGDEVTVSKAFLAENGTPPGLTSTSFAKALLEKQAANTKAIRKARENMTVKDLAKTDKYIENYSKATTGMLEASNGIKLTKGFMLDVAGDKVTGFKPAFQSLWSRASAVLGKDAPKSYTDRDVAVADMKKVFQQLIPLTLGRDQSANSISDRDVSFLADAFVTEQVMQGGVGALVAMPKEILLDKSRKIIERFQTAQIENASKLNAYDAQAQEFILPSGASIGTLVESEKKRLGRDLPTFKQGKKYSRGEDGVIKLVTVKDN
jgi:hypothetical protein